MLIARFAEIFPLILCTFDKRGKDILTSKIVSQRICPVPSLHDDYTCVLPQIPKTCTYSLYTPLFFFLCFLFLSIIRIPTTHHGHPRLRHYDSDEEERNLFSFWDDRSSCASPLLLPQSYLRCCQRRPQTRAIMSTP